MSIRICVSVLCAPPRDSGGEVTAGARSRVSQVRAECLTVLCRFAITAQYCAACDDGCSCCIITRFVFLNPTDEPFLSLSPIC